MAEESSIANPLRITVHGVDNEACGVLWLYRPSEIRIVIDPRSTTQGGDWFPVPARLAGNNVSQEITKFGCTEAKKIWRYVGCLTFRISPTLIYCVTVYWIDILITFYVK